jgi:hypothetical protein
MRALPGSFHSHHRQLLQRERFIPELLIFESARDIGLDIVPASGEYSIVRAGGRVEQSFRHKVPSVIQTLRESAAAYVVITETGATWQASYLYRRWAKHSGVLLRIFVAIAYPAFKRLKNRVTPRAQLGTNGASIGGRAIPQIAHFFDTTQQTGACLNFCVGGI